MAHELLVGTAEVDITPPVGTQMMGSLDPRPSTGIADPLLAKVITLTSGPTRMAYIIFDLCVWDRAFGDRIVAAASAASGIPTEHIIWSCSHTHSGPCTVAELYAKEVAATVDVSWRENVPAPVGKAVAAALARQQPMRVSRGRAYQLGVAHNRRLAYKDGRQINTWLLHGGEEEVQCVGAAGPIDPEVGILAFDDLDGRLQAVLFHFSLHANAHFGSQFSGDYPAVVAARLREAFGPQVTTLFMPGACGDQNPVRSYREIGDALAGAIIPQLRGRRPWPEPPHLSVRRLANQVPLRDWRQDQDARIRASQWPVEFQDRFFRAQWHEMQAAGKTEVEAVQHVWHLGDVAFATFPGELFVEHGLRLKRESPFPWAFPVELCSDSLGYLVTRAAYAAGGYESLIASTGQIAPEGVEQMVDHALAGLRELSRPAAAPAPAKGRAPRRRG